MNASSDSPLEPLAIDCFSHGLLTAINNIWAWVAFIIAAVEFWRISSPSRRGSELSASSYSSTEELEHATVSPPGVTNHLMPAPASYCVLDSEGSPKGKFSVYYSDDLAGIGDGGEGDGGCNAGGSAAEREELEWWYGDNWERAMVVRMGDMGWYRCQDLKALDGSVVRLWDSRRRGVAAAALVAWSGRSAQHQVWWENNN